MILSHTDPKTGGLICLLYDESKLGKHYFLSQQGNNLLTVLWNRGQDKEISVDDKQFLFASNHVLFLVPNQTFHIEDATSIVAWQFNRDFYCIIDHDDEVSCAGLLFYGSNEQPLLHLDDQAKQSSLSLLYQVFLEEFNEEDNLQTEMLRVILKRLIVKLTRMYKHQHSLQSMNTPDLDLVRKFNLLVESHYHEFHQVQDYADMLHKSPKTISNLFSKYSEKSPLEVIHERIVLEIKRLLLFSEMTAKEIGREVGFSEFSNFSRFFKKYTTLSPSKYRETFRSSLNGNN
jgi:AraC-like DNA-binding protein